MTMQGNGDKNQADRTEPASEVDKEMFVHAMSSASPDENGVTHEKQVAHDVRPEDRITAHLITTHLRFWIMDEGMDM